MDFIAKNCNLGLAIQEVLAEVITNEELRDRALRLYVESFESTYSAWKEDLPDMTLSGKAITSKEYPVEQDRQYFEAIIYEPVESQNAHGKETKSDMGRGRDAKIKFGKIEAMEPKNLKNNREHDRKHKRKPPATLKDRGRKQVKPNSTVPPMVPVLHTRNGVN